MNRVLWICLLALALTGCGGGGSTSGAAAPTSSAPQSSSTPAPPPVSTSAASSDDTALKVAAQAYSNAFLTGASEKAYALLSKRCQARMSQPDFAAIVSQAKAAYGAAIPFTTFHAEMNGNQARVTYTYRAAPAINQTQEPWVKEAGGWHEDDC